MGLVHSFLKNSLKCFSLCKSPLLQSSPVCRPGPQFLLIDDVYVSGFKNFLTGIQLKLWCCDTALLLLNWTLYLMSLEQNSSRKLSLSPFCSFSLTAVSYTVLCCRSGACGTSEAGNRLWAVEKSKCSHTLVYFKNLFSNFCFRFPNLSLETLPLDDVRPLTNWPLSVMTTEAAGPVWARELPVALFPFLDLPQVLCFLPLPHGIPGWEMLVSFSSFSWRQWQEGSLSKWHVTLWQQLNVEKSYRTDEWQRSLNYTGCLFWN